MELTVTVFSSVLLDASAKSIIDADALSGQTRPTGTSGSALTRGLITSYHRCAGKAQAQLEPSEHAHTLLSEIALSEFK